MQVEDTKDSVWLIHIYPDRQEKKYISYIELKPTLRHYIETV